MFSTLILAASLVITDIAILILVKGLRLQNNINRLQNKINRAVLKELEKTNGQDRAE